MAKPPENTQEPSIEEILDSIRQIISDEDEQQSAAPAAAGEDVLELTERVQDQNIQVEMKDPDPEPAPVQAAPPPPPPEPKPQPKPEPVAAAPEPPKPAAPPPAPRPEPVQSAGGDADHDLNSILTKNAEDSVMGAFTELNKRANVARLEGVTVEDIVREELRPMLKQWLDKNLPPLVERLLKSEMERLTKRVLGEDV